MIRSIMRIVVVAIAAVTLNSAVTSAQTPSPALLILEKEDQKLAIVDPATLKVIGRVPAGIDPHEICVSADGKTAFISNYGAFSTAQHTLSVVDLAAQKPLPAIDLGALRAPHGIQTSDNKIYFTAEGSKAIGRYEPVTRKCRLDFRPG